MTERIGREIRLKSRPVGVPREEDFELVEVPVPEPVEGEVLTRNIFMSVDPYMRGRMSEGKSYVSPFRLGEPLDGGSVGQVIESRNSGFRVGEYVAGSRGWREYFVSDGSDLSRIDPGTAPIQSFLGVLGMPGMTAWVGLLDIGQPQAGETVFVSAASGAVGSAVCQIAKIRGCRVVGSAGSDEKIKWLQEEAHVDGVINYKKAQNLMSAVAEAFPEGIDIYYDNVGGPHLEAAIEHMRPCGRIVLCGMISQYNATKRPPGPGNLFIAIQRRLTLKGFIVSDHMHRIQQFHSEMGKWIKDGKIKWRETIVDGIEQAPKAFLGLFKGENLGKMLVKIGPDPAV